jgi:hypothetical protein
MDIRRISFKPATISLPLALVATALVVVNLSMQLYRLYSGHPHVFGLAMMTLDGEHNVPSLFSTYILLLAAGLLTVIAVLERLNKTADALKWAILAAGFLLMSADEDISFHEMTMGPIRSWLGVQHLGIFYYAWVIPGLALVTILGIYFLPFLLRLPRRTAWTFAISGAIYLGGAIGVELFEGWWREGRPYLTVPYHLMVSLEEGMEMSGVILFIHALLTYIATHYGEIGIRVESTRTVMVKSPEQQPAATALARSSGD